ncbi:MAG TPA: SPOR domain-containing protein [Gallionellaceae bacterium]|nr:SPOR domain-containing protein [Gallionellaceae bacterium]
MAKQILTDEESNLKRQARRRLLGAIALTILVVVVLPMVLDSEPPAPSKDIELQIPDKDKVGEFVPKMVLPPLNANDAASQAASAPVIAPLLDVKPVSAVVVQPKVEDKPGIEAKNGIETKPVTEAKPATEAKSRAEPTIKPTETKPKADAKPAVKPGSKAHSGFVVQVGAFAKADAAKKLQEKLHKQGYPSYTEKSGDKIRVRIGDYATHTEADKVRRKLEIQGMQPNVVNLN